MCHLRPKLLIPCICLKEKVTLVTDIHQLISYIACLLIILEIIVFLFIFIYLYVYYLLRQGRTKYLKLARSAHLSSCLSILKH